MDPLLESGVVFSVLTYVVILYWSFTLRRYQKSKSSSTNCSSISWFKSNPFHCGCKSWWWCFWVLLALVEVAPVSWEGDLYPQWEITRFILFIHSDHTPIVPLIPMDSAQILLIADTGDLGLLGKICQQYLSIFQSIPIVNIDHHSTNMSSEHTILLMWVFHLHVSWLQRWSRRSFQRRKMHV